jgi:hypothetical protein
MADKQRIALEQRVARNPVLADFASPLPRIGEVDGGSVPAGLKRLAGALGRVDKAAAIQVTVAGTKGEPRRWHLRLAPDGGKVVEGAHEKPDLEIIVGEENWSRIAAGEISPLDAFFGGNLRVRGDLTLARLAARALQRG